MQANVCFVYFVISGSPMPERVIPAEITEAQLDDMMMRMLATTGIPTGKNVYHLRVYEQSFAGTYTFYFFLNNSN